MNGTRGALLTTSMTSLSAGVLMLLFAPQSSGAPVAKPTIAIGKTTPAFTLTDLEGKPRRLAEFAGRPVALTFFCGCEWCAEYARQWGDLQRANALPERAVTLVVYQGMEADTAKSVVDSVGLEYKPDAPRRAVVLADPTFAVSDPYNAEPCPRVFVLDDKGRLVYTNDHKDDAARVAPASRIIERALKALKNSKDIPVRAPARKSAASKPILSEGHAVRSLVTGQGGR